MVYITKQQLLTRIKRYKALNKMRLQHALALMGRESRFCLSVVPVLLHYNHINLIGYRPHAPHGIDLFSVNQEQHNYLNKSISPSAPALQEPEFCAILGIYAMGSTSSLGQGAGSDLDLWVCTKTGLSTDELSILQDKCRLISSYAKSRGVELNLFVTPQDRFTNFQPDSLDEENCGSAQNFFLLDEFYRTSIRLCGRYILWYLISSEEEQTNYQAYTRFLLKGESGLPGYEVQSGAGFIVEPNILPEETLSIAEPLVSQDPLPYVKSPWTQNKQWLSPWSGELLASVHPVNWSSWAEQYQKQQDLQGQKTADDIDANDIEEANNNESNLVLTVNTAELGSPLSQSLSVQDEQQVVQAKLALAHDEHQAFLDESSVVQAKLGIAVKSQQVTQNEPYVEPEVFSQLPTTSEANQLEQQSATQISKEQQETAFTQQKCAKHVEQVEKSDIRLADGAECNLLSQDNTDSGSFVELSKQKTQENAAQFVMTDENSAKSNEHALMRSWRWVSDTSSAWWRTTAMKGQSFVEANLEKSALSKHLRPLTDLWFKRSATEPQQVYILHHGHHRSYGQYEIHIIVGEQNETNALLTKPSDQAVSCPPSQYKYSFDSEHGQQDWKTCAHIECSEFSLQERFVLASTNEVAANATAPTYISSSVDSNANLQAASILAKANQYEAEHKSEQNSLQGASSGHKHTLESEFTPHPSLFDANFIFRTDYKPANNSVLELVSFMPLYALNQENSATLQDANSKQHQEGDMQGALVQDDIVHNGVAHADEAQDQQDTSLRHGAQAKNANLSDEIILHATDKSEWLDSGDANLSSLASDEVVVNAYITVTENNLEAEDRALDKAEYLVQADSSSAQSLANMPLVAEQAINSAPMYLARTQDALVKDGALAQAKNDDLAHDGALSQDALAQDGALSQDALAQDGALSKNEALSLAQAKSGALAQDDLSQADTLAQDSALAQGKAATEESCLCHGSGWMQDNLTKQSGDAETQVEDAYNQAQIASDKQASEEGQVKLADNLVSTMATQTVFSKDKSQINNTQQESTAKLSHGSGLYIGGDAVIWAEGVPLEQAHAHLGMPYDERTRMVCLNGESISEFTPQSTFTAESEYAVASAASHSTSLFYTEAGLSFGQNVVKVLGKLFTHSHVVSGAPLSAAAIMTPAIDPSGGAQDRPLQVDLALQQSLLFTNKPHQSLSVQQEPSLGGLGAGLTYSNMMLNTQAVPNQKVTFEGVRADKLDEKSKKSEDTLVMSLGQRLVEAVGANPMPFMGGMGNTGSFEAFLQRSDNLLQDPLRTSAIEREVELTSKERGKEENTWYFSEPDISSLTTNLPLAPVQNDLARGSAYGLKGVEYESHRVGHGRRLDAASAFLSSELRSTRVNDSLFMAETTGLNTQDQIQDRLTDAVQSFQPDGTFGQHDGILNSCPAAESIEDMAGQTGVHRQIKVVSKNNSIKISNESTALPSVYGARALQDPALHLLSLDEALTAAHADDWQELEPPLDENEWFDFGSISRCSPTEYFGSGLWLLYKAIDSPFKVVLKILLMEAYSSDYTQNRLLASELKDYMLSHDDYSIDLDAYYLMYLKVSQYLQKMRDPRLTLMRKCFYLKIFMGISQKRPYSNADYRLKRELLNRFSKHWGWSDDFVRQLERVDYWKMAQVREFYQEVYRTLFASYQALLRFSVRHGIEYAITSDDAGILSRKLYAAFDLYPGKILVMHTSFSNSLEERNLTFIKPSASSLCRQGWHLFTTHAKDVGLLNMRAVYIGSRLCEVVTWASLNGLLTSRTTNHICGANSIVSPMTIRQLSNDVNRVLRPGLFRVSERSLQRTRELRCCVILLNLEQDPTALISNRMLDIDMGSTLCCGRQRICLIGSVDLVLINSWGEVRSISLPDGEDGVVELLATMLRIIGNTIETGNEYDAKYEQNNKKARSRGDLEDDEQAKQFDINSIWSAIEVCCYASAYSDLIKYDMETTMHQVIGCLSASNSSEFMFDVGRNSYMARSDGRRGVMINSRGVFANDEFDIRILSRYGMRPEYSLQVPAVVDRYATMGIVQYFFSAVGKNKWDIYIINERNEVSIYRNFEGSRAALVNAINRFYTSQSQSQVHRHHFNHFNLPQYFVLNKDQTSLHPFTIRGVD